MNHPFFASTSWQQLEDAEYPCNVEHMVAGLMEPSADGGYSPAEKAIDLKDPKRRARKLMSFDEISVSLVPRVVAPVFSTLSIFLSESSFPIKCSHLEFQSSGWQPAHRTVYILV